MKRAPNFVLIVVDSMRYDIFQWSLSFYPEGFFNIVANSGLSFSQVISVNSSTVPCFASILTGKYPFEHGVYAQMGPKIKRNIPLMQEVLQQKGWYTHAELTGPHWEGLGYLNGFHKINKREPDRAIGKYGDNIYTEWWDKLLADIQDFPSPFFLLLHLWELHFPIVPPPQDFLPIERNISRYHRAILGLSKKLKDLYKILPENTYIILTADHGEKIYKSDRLSFLSLLRSFNNVIQYYLLKIKILNKLIRNIQIIPNKILQTLSKNKIISPHSIGLGHGFHVFEYLIHIPLVIFPAPDDFSEGSIENSLRSQIDIFPTILKLAGIDDIKDCSYSRPLFNNRGHEYVFIEANNGNRFDPERFICGIRTNRYKYITQPYSSKPWEALYDLYADPDEKVNLLETKITDKAILERLDKEVKLIYKQNFNRLIERGEDRDLTDEETEERFKLLKELGYF